MESGPREVLVCDDTESIRLLLRINLELEGYLVRDFASGEEVVAYLSDQDTGGAVLHKEAGNGRSVIALLVDAQIARGNGWWVLSQVRALPGGEDLPVLLVTASVQKHDRRQAQRAGFDAMIAKPFDPEEVLDVVSRCARAGRTGLGAL